jgi:hypothetical protein
MVAGAAGSLGLVLYTGRNNPSALLIIIFMVWVLSPFAALLVASVLSKQWFVHTRGAIYVLMPILAIGSLVSYSGALSPPGTKPAFVFLVVPLISWLLMAIVIPIAAARARRLTRRGERV